MEATKAAGQDDVENLVDDAARDRAERCANMYRALWEAVMDENDQDIVKALAVWDEYPYDDMINDDDTVSALRIIQAMSRATTQLTGARLGDLLLKLFKPLTEMPVELRQLEPTYKVYKESLTSIASLDIELHPVIQCFIGRFFSALTF